MDQECPPFETEESVDSLITSALALLPNVNEIMKSLGIDSSLASISDTKDDLDSYIDNLVEHFNSKWYEINFGDYIMREYIQVCTNRTVFPVDFFKSYNFTLRY